MKKVTKLIPISIFAISITTITVLIIMSLKGLDINTETGEIERKGVVDIASLPNKALIKLDNQLTGDSTKHRVSLKEGTHEIGLSKPGFRSWSSEVFVNYSKVYDLTYPILVARQPSITKIANLSANLEDTHANGTNEQLYVVERKTNNTGDKFFTINVFNTDQAKFANTAVFIDTSVVPQLKNSNAKDAKLSIKDVFSDQLLLKLELNDQSWFFIMPDYKTGETQALHQLVNDEKQDVEEASFTADGKILLTTSAQTAHLVESDDDEYQINQIARGVEDIAHIENDVYLLIENDNKNMQWLDLAQAEQDQKRRRTSLLVDNNSKVFSSTYGNKTQFALIKGNKLSVFDYSQLETNDLSQPIYDTQISINLVVRSDNQRNFLFTNDFSGLSYDFDRQVSSTISFKNKLDLNLHPVWHDRLHFVAGAGSQLLLSDYDGSNQYWIEAGKPLKAIYGLSDDRKKITALTQDNTLLHVDLHVNQQADEE